MGLSLGFLSYSTGQYFYLCASSILIEGIFKICAVFLNFPPKHHQTHTQYFTSYSLCLKCLFFFPPLLYLLLLPTSVFPVSSSHSLGRWLKFSFLCNIIPHLLISFPHNISLIPVQIWPSHFYVAINICSQLHYNNSLYFLFVYSNIPPLDHGPLDGNNPVLFFFVFPERNTLFLCMLIPCLQKLCVKQRTKSFLIYLLKFCMYCKYFLLLFHISFNFECFLLYDHVFIHDVNSVNIFPDGLCFIFHLGRLFLYENYEHIFLYFLSVLLLFLFFSQELHIG